MISIKNVSKNFDTVKSLQNVSMVIEKGSIFGIIGSNGSGKSTLLRIMCGVYSATDGKVCCDGENVWQNNCIKSSIVYLSDNQFFLPHSTTRDMMELYASVYPSFSREKYDSYVKLFGIEERRKISTFSKGMQKQVSFIIGLACSTDYIFCDETLDGLDPVMRQTVRRIVASEVAERGVTVVFASHNLKEIEDICDHVALLHRGELLFEAGIDDIKLGIHKIQLSFSKDKADNAEEELERLAPISLERRMSLFTILVRGDERELSYRIADLGPLFVEFIPLTLEEIFMTEMEERGYEFSEIIG